MTRLVPLVLVFATFAAPAAGQSRPATPSPAARHADSLYDRQDYGAAAQAYRVILAGVYQQQRIPDAERLHPEDVVRMLAATGTPAELHPDAEAIIQAIAPLLHSGDVVALLSNGGFDGIYEKLPARLMELNPSGNPA